MKLKEITKKTLVYTPTEAEAEELFGILHENGYANGYCSTITLREIKKAIGQGANICFRIRAKYWNLCAKEWYQKEGHLILTLAEFKERYVLNEDSFAKSEERYFEMTEQMTEEAEESSVIQQKSQPKFEMGDKVYETTGTDRLAEYTVKKVYMGKRGSYVYDLQGLIGIIGVEESDLCLTNQNPYTEPETKPTEDMETKENRNLSQDVANCDKPEGKNLNLCELLQGHEGEAFYSPQYGWVELVAGNPSLYPNTIATTIPGTSGLAYYLPNGKYLKSDSSACVSLYPSRALYEQYPLDPYTAWMKWQEERIQYKAHLMLDAKPECAFSSEADSYELTFRTTADRDKCIEEIKAIIEKYSK